MALLLIFLLSSTVISAKAVPSGDSTSSDRTSSLGDLITESCDDNYNSLSCLKTLAASLVPAIAVPRKLELWPGMSLNIGGFQPQRLSSSEAVDGYLIKALKSFLASFSLKIRVLDQDVTNGLKRFGKTVVGRGEDEARARRRKGNNGILLGGALSAGILLAVGMAAISAMAAKALLMSLVSSGMMLMSKNGGSNHAKTTYEVIHAVPHEDEGHRRWSAGADEYKIIKSH